MIHLLAFALTLTVFVPNASYSADALDLSTSSAETTDEIVALAEQCAAEAKSTAAGNYGDIDLMNNLIDELSAAESILLDECQALDGITDEDVAACEQTTSDVLSKARGDVIIMRDIDIEDDIIILFGRYWRPNACLGGKSYGAPAYGRDECFYVEENVTIHGIWPSSSNVRVFPNPVNCTDPMDLKREDVDDLEPRLHEKWVSYYPDWTNFEFWQWEWYKHGSCWNRTKQEFLQQALDWHDIFDVPKIMQNEGIPLGVMVNTTEVMQTLANNMWGARLGLLCINEGVHIDQIFACWDWSGKNPINCPPASQCNDQVMFRVYTAEDIPSASAPSTRNSPSSPGAKATSGVVYIVFTSMLFSFLLYARM